MMNNYRPITLRPEDQAEPADPQTAMLDHTDAMRLLSDEIDGFVSLLTRWGSDPTGVLHRAQPRAVDLRELMARALDTREALAQSYRAAGAFSATYSDDLGAR